MNGHRVSAPRTSLVLPLLVLLALHHSSAAPPPAQARLGINLSGLADWNTEHPFTDVFRLSRQWISQREGAPWGKGPELERDAEGWVKRLEPDCRAETPFLTGGHAPNGQYLCFYDGDGDIEFKNNSKIISQVPGKIVVEINGTKGGVFLSLKRTNPTNYVRNIRILTPEATESSSLNPFSIQFLKRWQGFDTLRFMDWQETNGSKQKDWANRPRTNDCNYTEHGAPVEVMIDLCNRLPANPWFCLPHEATDDYVRQFALATKALLKPGLKVYVEYSNEVWNGMFPQHQYAARRGKELGLGAPERPWEGAALFHARRSLEIFRIWEDVFGGKDRLVRVISWQAASGDYWTDKMLLGQEGVAKGCDALAIAPYISLLLGPNSKPTAAEAASWTVERLLDFAETNALPESLRWIKTQKAVADKYGVKLLAYEAGQHLVGVGGGENNETLTNLLIEANRHPRMGQLYTQYLDGWREASGDLCCLFSSVANPSKWGNWGLLEHAGQTAADAPKFKAVMEWKMR